MRPRTGGEATRALYQSDSNYWYTPMYFHEVWTMRRVFHSLDRLTAQEWIKPEAQAEPEPEKEKTEMSKEKPQSTGNFRIDENGQLTLFNTGG